MKCPLCDGTEFRYQRVTANGDRKYCCLVCKTFFTDHTVTNFYSPPNKKFRSPEINFLHSVMERNAISPKDTQRQKISQSIIDLLKLAIHFIHVSLGNLQEIKIGLTIINFFQLTITCFFNLLFNIKTKSQSYRWGLLGFLVALCIYSSMCIWLKIDINQPNVYDSYTLQALAWRSGHLNLTENYSWLEIANYKGKYFLSFPPVPTIPMLLLSFFFNEKTPSTWFMIFCFFSGYLIAYKLLRRFRSSDIDSAIWAVFLICGSSYLDISLFGQVWYMAQSMSFVLTLACILCLTYSNSKIQGIGLFCFALAVGCRPLQAVYTPLLLTSSIKRNQKQTIWKTIQLIAPMLIAPFIVAVTLGTLNFLRFDSVFEFGHNYLPALAVDPQFSLSYIPQNFVKLFITFPTINSLGKLQIPLFGFAFYIANPIFILLGLRMITNSYKDKIYWVLLGNTVLHFLFLMMHITFGAWQFGTRFLVDLLPIALVLCIRGNRSLKLYEIAIMLLGIAFNMYGCILFRTS